MKSDFRNPPWIVPTSPIALKWNDDWGFYTFYSKIMCLYILIMIISSGHGLFFQVWRLSGRFQPFRETGRRGSNSGDSRIIREGWQLYDLSVLVRFCSTCSFNHFWHQQQLHHKKCYKIHLNSSKNVELDSLKQKYVKYSEDFLIPLGKISQKNFSENCWKASHEVSVKVMFWSTRASISTPFRSMKKRIKNVIKYTPTLPKAPRKIRTCYLKTKIGEIFWRIPHNLGERILFILNLLESQFKVELSVKVMFDKLAQAFQHLFAEQEQETPKTDRKYTPTLPKERETPKTWYKIHANPSKSASQN